MAVTTNDPQAVERGRVHKLWQAKLAADPWNGWRALLGNWDIEGTKVPVDPNFPFTGYYRTKRKDKTFAPVAYWYDKGELICLVDGRQIDGVYAIDQWPWISRYPISHAWYVAVVDEGKPWPDADARLTPQALSAAPYAPAAAEETQPPAAGHNNPPEETPLQVIKNKIENAKGGVDDYKVIADDETLARAKSLKNRLTELSGEADKERKVLKEPHKKAGEDIDDEWMPVVKDAAAAAKQINDAMDAWATKKLQLQRQAEAEFARRKAAADAVEAENARKLREAEAEGAPAPELEAVPQVEEAPTPDVAGTTVRPGYGRAGSIKSKWVVTGISDANALFAFLVTHKELREKMIELAQRAKDAGLDPPGVTMEEMAKVR